MLVAASTQGGLAPDTIKKHYSTYLGELNTLVDEIKEQILEAILNISSKPTEDYPTNPLNSTVQEA